MAPLVGTEDVLCVKSSNNRRYSHKERSGTGFAGLTAGYPLTVPNAKSDQPDDHRELFEAETEEAEVEEEREEAAVQRTDRAAEEYEEEKEGRGR